MNIEIADRLVKLRKEHNLSQEALASKLGLSRQAVSKWERAEASPDTDNLVALAELYGVPLDEILNGPKAQEEDTPNNEPTKAELKEKKLADMSERQRVGRKMVKFPFPILIAAAYLLLGFMNGNWHPGWIYCCLYLFTTASAVLFAAEPKRQCFSLCRYILYWSRCTCSLALPRECGIRNGLFSL